MFPILPLQYYETYCILMWSFSVVHNVITCRFFFRSRSVSEVILFREGKLWFLLHRCSTAPRWIHPNQMGHVSYFWLYRSRARNKAVWLKRPNAIPLTHLFGTRANTILDLNRATGIGLDFLMWGISWEQMSPIGENTRCSQSCRPLLIITSATAVVKDNNDALSSVCYDG